MAKWFDIRLKAVTKPRSAVAVPKPRSVLGTTSLVSGRNPPSGIQRPGFSVLSTMDPNTIPTAGPSSARATARPVQSKDMKFGQPYARVQQVLEPVLKLTEDRVRAIVRFPVPYETY